MVQLGAARGSPRARRSAPAVRLAAGATEGLDAMGQSTADRAGARRAAPFGEPRPPLRHGRMAVANRPAFGSRVYAASARQAAEVEVVAKILKAEMGLIPWYVVWLKMVVTALWSKEDDDHEDDVFEHDMRLYKPGSDHPDTLFMGELQFTARNHRLEVMIAGMPFTVAGTIVFESRLRKKGIARLAQSEIRNPHPHCSATR